MYDLHHRGLFVSVFGADSVMHEQPVGARFYILKLTVCMYVGLSGVLLFCMQ